jgi:hypothetical protein
MQVHLVSFLSAVMALAAPATPRKLESALSLL